MNFCQFIHFKRFSDIEGKDIGFKSNHDQEIIRENTIGAKTLRPYILFANNVFAGNALTPNGELPIFFRASKEFANFDPHFNVLKFH